MPSNHEVTFEIEAGVAVITLDAPDRKNALTPEMAQALVEVCDEIDADHEVGAAVVRGASGTFCSGAHRDQLARAGHDPAEIQLYREMGSVYQSFARVGRLAVPTIAAVRGAAVGAGVNLMLATDLRIVAEDVRVLSGFQRIGITPGGGHVTLLGRTAGWEAAAAMALFSEEIDGRRAVEIGMAWESVPADAVDERAVELARRPAQDPELAREAVRIQRHELGPPSVSWPVALETERATQMWSLRRRQQLGRT